VTDLPSIVITRHKQRRKGDRHFFATVWIGSQSVQRSFLSHKKAQTWAAWAVENFARALVAHQATPHGIDPNVLLDNYLVELGELRREKAA